MGSPDLWCETGAGVGGLSLFLFEDHAGFMADFDPVHWQESLAVSSIDIAPTIGHFLDDYGAHLTDSAIEVLHITCDRQVFAIFLHVAD